MKYSLIIIGLIAFTGCQQDNANNIIETIKPVKMMRVNNFNGNKHIKLPGIVRASKRAELSFNVPGQIISINAEEGSEVKKGNVIAELDKSNYENRHNSALANLKEARLSFERYSKLFKEKTVSKADMDRSKKLYDIAKASEKLAKKDLEDTSLRAYFSGTIAARYVDNFQNIKDKQTIVSVEDKSAMEIVVNVPEIEMLRGKKEDIISIVASFDAFPKKRFQLAVKEISEKIDFSTRTYAVTLSMKTTYGLKFLSGMTANVDVEMKTNKQNIISIPATSVMGDSNNEFFVWVYKVSEKSVLKRKVTVGEIIGTNIQILSGLNSNEIIAIAGVNYLTESMKVKPLSRKIGGAL